MAVPATISLTVGGLLYSALFDRYGNYQLACAIGAGCWAVSAALMLVSGFAERRTATAALAD